MHQQREVICSFVSDFQDASSEGLLSPSLDEISDSKMGSLLGKAHGLQVPGSLVACANDPSFEAVPSSEPHTLTLLIFIALFLRA